MAQLVARRSRARCFVGAGWRRRQTQPVSMLASRRHALAGELRLQYCSIQAGPASRAWYDTYWQQAVGQGLTSPCHWYVRVLLRGRLNRSNPWRLLHQSLGRDADFVHPDGGLL